jgi:hypothetical protein
MLCAPCHASDSRCMTVPSTCLPFPLDNL